MDEGILEGQELNIGKNPASKLKVSVGHVSDERLGGAFQKSRIDARAKNSENGNDKNLKLVVKEVWIEGDDLFGNARDDMNIAQRYYERWKFLRKAGIPTVSSMRIVDANHVAMGDMTADGSSFFGKARQELLDFEERYKVHRTLTPIEKTFMAIDPQVLKDALSQFQESAWNKGILLPSDDPFDILVRSDGRFQIMIVDISLLRKRREFMEHNILDWDREFITDSVDVLRDYFKHISSG